MAPKKNKGIDSFQSFDALRFVSFTTKEKYTSHIKLKPILERGLVQFLEYNVKKVILDNKWEILCEHPALVVVLVVREFYANGIERDGLTVLVWGKQVPFDWTTINRYCWV